MAKRKSSARYVKKLRVSLANCQIMAKCLAIKICEKSTVNGSIIKNTCINVLSANVKLKKMVDVQI